MSFGDFVENVIGTPICCELKQHLDKLYEIYIKDPEKCEFYLIPSRGSKYSLSILLPLLLKMYKKEDEE